MTSSPRAHQLLSNWETARNLFWQVITQAEAARTTRAELPHLSVAAAFEQSIPVAAVD